MSANVTHVAIVAPVSRAASSSRFAGFSIFLRKELHESLRTGRLFVVAAIFLVFGLASPLLAKYTPELAKLGGSKISINLPPPTATDAVVQFLKNVGNNGVLIAVLLAMGVVAREKERGTAAFALAKPLTRQAFLAAKFATLAATLAAGLAVAGAAAYAYTALLFKPTPAAGFVVCCALLLGQMLVYAAVTFLGSTIMRSSLPAAGIGAAAIVVFAVLGLAPAIVDYTPAGLVNAAAAVALGQPAAHLAQALVANAAVILAALTLAWLSFRSQEQLAG